MIPRESILEFVFEKVAMCGLKGLSMDKIASELKISKKSIYNYFEGKNELIDSSVRYGCEMVVANIEKIASSMPDPLTATVFMAVDIVLLKSRLNDKLLYDSLSSSSLGDYFEKTRNRINNIRYQFVSKSVEQGYITKEIDIEELVDISEESVPMQRAFHLVTENLMSVATRKGKEALFELKENYS